MVRSVTTNVNSNVYAPFQTSGVNYSITSPITKEQKNETETRTEKKTKALGYKIGGTALLVGFGVLALIKGLPKGTRLNFDKSVRFLAEKIEKLTEKHKKLSFAQNFYLKGLRGLQNAAYRARALYNIGPFRDVWPKIHAKKFPLIDKTFNWITNIFEIISVKTSRRAYAKTMSKFENMSAKFLQINEGLLRENPNRIVEINGIKKSVSEWIKEIEAKNSHISTQYQESFGHTASQKRLAKVKDDMKDLDQNVYDETWGKVHGLNFKELFKNEKLYQKFISEAMVAPAKKELFETINGLRRPISNTLDNNHNEARSLIGTLSALTDPTDKTARTLIRDLRGLADEHILLSSTTNLSKKSELSKEFSKKLEALHSHISCSGKYDEHTIGDAYGHIRSLGSSLTHKRGEVEEILNIYKQLLPEKDYKVIKKTTGKATNALNKSINKEMELFDKIRDLQVGSAPMDVLGMLVPLAYIGWGLQKADNNDERISVGLKYGIPAIGAIATTLYCTAGLISGGASIIFGLAAGVAINKLGEYADKKIKELKKNPIKLNQMPLPTLTLKNSGDK